MQDPSTIMASTTLLKAISFPHSNALVSFIGYNLFSDVFTFPTTQPDGANHPQAVSRELPLQTSEEIEVLPVIRIFNVFFPNFPWILLRTKQFTFKNGSIVCTCTSKYTHTAEERIENGSQRREERKDALALVVLATAVAAKPTARERESSLKRDASERERARTLSLPSMEPRAASLSPREERARAGGAVEEVIGCEAKIIFVDNGFQFGVLELACKIYSPRTLKAVAIENPNDADQAAEIVLSELHRDLILPLPWKRYFW
ncbi:hypothetical protein AHAS_Ahas17G0079700 [Arachis hypogaea]